MAQIGQACARTTGSFVLLTGEAGIGKSMLAHSAAALAGRPILRGYCVDNVGAPALWPWLRAARDDAPLTRALTSGTGDDAAGFRRAQAVRDALADIAGDSGLLIVVEDLQWADSASIELLTLLLPEVESLHLVLVGTARSSTGPTTPFDRAVPTILRSDGVVHLPLNGLDATAVRRWLTDAGADWWAARAADLVAATGGNPFYIGALTRELEPNADLVTGIAARPTLMRTLTAAQLTLSDQVRATVGTAAVLGERLSPALLASALRLPVETVSAHLADAVAVGLLRFGPTGLAFRHALVRDAVLAELPVDQRSDAHAAVARALADTGEPMLAGAAATHWHQVPGPDAAAKCHAAARRAAADYAALSPERAVEFARLAVAAGRRVGVDDSERADDLAALARHSWAAGQVHETLRVCAAAMELAAGAGRTDLLADLALIPQGVGSLDVARIIAPMCARALAVTGLDQPTRRARLLALGAVCAVEEQLLPVDGPGPATANVAPQADELSSAAITLASIDGDVQAELEVIAARHFVLSHPRAIDERTRLAARAVELAPRAATSMGQLWGHLWQVDIAMQRGRYDGVESSIAAIEAVAERRGSPVARWHALRTRAALRTVTGDLAAARAAAEASVALARRVGDVAMVGQYYAYQQHLAALRGCADDLPADTEAVLRAAPPIPLVLVGVPMMQVTIGDLAAARAAFAPLRTLPRRLRVGPRWAGTVYTIGSVAIALGDVEVARDCYRAFEPLAAWCSADGGGSPFTTGSFELILGDLAHCCGDPRDVGHYERAIDRNDQIGARPFAALARLGLADALAGRDPARSAALARVAVDEFTAMDMPGPLARAAPLASRRGASAPSATDPAGAALPTGERLTERELQIARLVGRARTNRQIADELVVSVRTVESHVRNALRKVGATTRTELAVWIGRRE